MLNFGVRVCCKWMHYLKKKTMLNLLVCSGTHANGVMALTLPNNLNITIYSFLSPFQENEKNDWSTVGKHEKAVSWLQPNFWSVSDQTSHRIFVFMFGHDLLLSRKLRIIHHASALYQLCCCSFGSVGMLRYDCLKISVMLVFAKWTK